MRGLKDRLRSKWGLGVGGDPAAEEEEEDAGDGEANPAVSEPLKNGFLLKMTGYQDFMLFEEEFLLNYDFVASQLLQQQVCHLNVVLLREKEATHLARSVCLGLNGLATAPRPIHIHTSICSHAAHPCL